MILVNDDPLHLFDDSPPMLSFSNSEESRKRPKKSNNNNSQVDGFFKLKKDKLPLPSPQANSIVIDLT